MPLRRIKLPLLAPLRALLGGLRASFSDCHLSIWSGLPSQPCSESATSPRAQETSHAGALLGCTGLCAKLAAQNCIIYRSVLRIVVILRRSCPCHYSAASQVPKDPIEAYSELRAAQFRQKHIDKAGWQPKHPPPSSPPPSLPLRPSHRPPPSSLPQIAPHLAFPGGKRNSLTSKMSATRTRDLKHLKIDNRVACILINTYQDYDKLWSILYILYIRVY